MSFVHPASLSSIQSLELRVKTIVEGFLSGLHKSPFHGFSVEFSEYRNYNQGDSLKYVDWKILAKTDRMMIKKFEADTNLSSQILFDVSASMNYSNKGITKLDYAKNLAAAIMYLLIKQNDAVALNVFSEDLNAVFKAKTGRSHLNSMLHYLDSLKGESTTDLESALAKLNQQLQRRGMFIIFTDFIGETEALFEQLSYLEKYGHELILFHLFQEDEIDFAFRGRQVFVDMESSEEIDVSPELIQEKYQALSKEFLEKMSYECRSRQVDYHLVKLSDFYETHLLEFLKKRQKLY